MGVFSLGIFRLNALAAFSEPTANGPPCIRSACKLYSFADAKRRQSVPIMLEDAGFRRMEGAQGQLLE